MSDPLAAPLSWETLDARQRSIRLIRTESPTHRYRELASWYFALDAAYRELVEKAQAVVDQFPESARECAMCGAVWFTGEPCASDCQIATLRALLPSKK